MTVTGKPAQIADALFARLATLSTGLTVEWPEAPSGANPDTDTSGEAVGRIEVTIFYNRPAWGGLSAGALNQGLLQVTVVWPKNRGVIAPMQVVAAVLDHFPQGLALFSGATKVRVSEAPWAASPISEPSEVRVPITIPWTA